jgi:spore maturation protein CgeB
MKIIYIGKFKKLWDEEYIARSFEALGHTVGRLDELTRPVHMIRDIKAFKPDIVIFAKFMQPYAEWVINECKAMGIKTVCWVFDLYFGYSRQHQLKTPAFTADHVFTTDGGNHDWKKYGINHQCVRQGIYEPECVIEKGEKIYDVIFVGSFNPHHEARNAMMKELEKDFDFKWFGKDNTDEIRGMKLNRLFAQAKIVVGDSVYSPFYWSNRVVETLGRGGFLIHADVEGIKEEYPDLVTYERGNYEDLKRKIEYYLTHDKERNAIIKKNFNHVRKNYTCHQKCQQLLSSIK